MRKRNILIIMLMIVSVLIVRDAVSLTQEDMDKKEAIITFDTKVTLKDIYNFLRSYELNPLNAFERNTERVFLISWKTVESVDEMIDKLQKDNRVKNCMPNFRMQLQTEDSIDFSVIIEKNKKGFNSDNYGDYYIADALLYRDCLDVVNPNPVVSDVTVIYLDSGFATSDIVKQLRSQGCRIGIGGQRGYGLDIVNDYNEEFPDFNSYGTDEEWVKAYNKWLENPVSDSNPRDSDGHGTFGGMLGLAYGCRILPVKITETHDNFGVYPFIKALSQINKMIGDGILTGDIIINMSFNCFSDDSIGENTYAIFEEYFNSFMKPLEDKGCLMFAAGCNHTKNVGREVFFGTLDGITLVEQSSFRTYGQRDVDMFAPGTAFSYKVSDGQVYECQDSGSSISTFITSMLAANIWQRNLNLTKGQIEAALLSSSFESGILNVALGNTLLDEEMQDFKSVISELGHVLSWDTVNVDQAIAQYKEIVSTLITSESLAGNQMQRGLISYYRDIFETELESIKSGGIETVKENSIILSMYNESEVLVLDALAASRIATVYQGLHSIVTGIETHDVENVRYGFDNLINDLKITTEIERCRDNDINYDFDSVIQRLPYMDINISNLVQLRDRVITDVETGTFLDIANIINEVMDEFVPFSCNVPSEESLFTESEVEFFPSVSFDNSYGMTEPEFCGTFMF